MRVATDREFQNNNKYKSAPSLLSAAGVFLGMPRRTKGPSPAGGGPIVRRAWSRSRCACPCLPPLPCVLHAPTPAHPCCRWRRRRIRRWQLQLLNLIRRAASSRGWSGRPRPSQESTVLGSWPTSRATRASSTTGCWARRARSLSLPLAPAPNLLLRLGGARV